MSLAACSQCCESIIGGLPPDRYDTQRCVRESIRVHHQVDETAGESGARPVGRVTVAIVRRNQIAGLAGHCLAKGAGYGPDLLGPQPVARLEPC